MLRTLAATAGPTVTGVLAGHDRFWIAFVTAGALRICYDLGLFAMFIDMKLYKHENHNSGKEIARQRSDSRQSELEDIESLP